MVNDHPTSLSEAIDTVSEALFLAGRLAAIGYFAHQQANPHGN